MFVSTALTAVLAGLFAVSVSADSDHGDRDFGTLVEQILKAQSKKWFGFGKPLAESAPETSGPYRTATQAAEDQVLLAKRLKVKYLTRNAGDATDMMAFFPAVNPTHLITCVEGDRALIATGKFNPSVQRISLATGAVTSILRGMSACDGIRTTPWGTVLATEERSDGGAYEILAPLSIADQAVVDRAAGTVTDPDHIAKRIALPTMAWEGIAVLSSGVVIAGDELRPGTPADADGGAIFKFIPSAPYGGSGLITALAQSPFVAGNVYALQVSCRDSTQQYGQGCEVGNAAWIAVNAATARLNADASGATGYYRPEDLHADPLFVDPANPAAVRVCWTNTGTESGKNYAEVLCAVDSDPLAAVPDTRSVLVNRFVEGDPDFNSFDNLDFQPQTGNLYVIEDHDNGDIFACLRDGGDRDIKTDGCVKMLSVKDSSAEPTGFIFSADGKTAYLSIQHSDDTDPSIAKVDDYATDDVLMITGFKIPK